MLQKLFGLSIYFNNPDEVLPKYLLAAQLLLK